MSSTAPSANPSARDRETKVQVLATIREYKNRRTHLQRGQKSATCGIRFGRRCQEMRARFLFCFAAVLSCNLLASQVHADAPDTSSQQAPVAKTGTPTLK